MGKPFNPLLGETYELVTPKFQYYTEQVSTKPPICCYHAQGSNWEISRKIEAKIKFSGRQVVSNDTNVNQIQITLKDGTIEKYEVNEPPMIVGNLVRGYRFAEPQGTGHVKNLTTGQMAEIKF